MTFELGNLRNDLIITNTLTRFESKAIQIVVSFFDGGEAGAVNFISCAKG